MLVAKSATSRCRPCIYRFLVSLILTNQLFWYANCIKPNVNYPIRTYTGCISYYFLYSNYFRMGTKTVALVPWTMPPIFSGYLVSGGSIAGATLQVVNFAIAVVIYYPFVLMCDRTYVQVQKLKQKEATIQYHFKNIIRRVPIARQNNYYIMFKR